MFRPSPSESAARRGVILLVVLSLLTLFAIVGLSFVLYAESEAKTSQIQREAGVHKLPEMQAELMFSYFLGQLVYDVPDDESGVWSAMRGHSLARLMYGYNAEWSNIIPFNGLGRVRTSDPPGGDRPFMNPFLRDDYRFINYTYHASDGFLRDPERLGPVGGPGWRTSATQPPGPFLAGINAPYTYADANNMFLGIVAPPRIRGFVSPPDGVVLAQSFHRDWLFRADLASWPGSESLGSLHPSNPNWQTPWGKYLLLRPRPIDMGPGFPYPEDEGGDVKNLIGVPGYHYIYQIPGTNRIVTKVCNNDSVWMDLGAPVMTTPDGKKYKALFAPFIMDLDSRVNLNVHGNVRAIDPTTGAPAHVSGQGWGPWEVNVSKVFPNNSRWYDLFRGNPAVPNLWGRYGPDGAPSRASTLAPVGRTPRFFAQANFDAARWEGAPNNRYVPLTAAQRVQLPSATTPLLSCFPTFPPGYENGYAPAGPGSPGLERWDHPLQYSYMQTNRDDLRFADSNLEALLRYGDTGSPALTSRLYSLTPNALADAAVRRLVTSRSFDVDRPGVSPYVYNLTATVPGFSGQRNVWSDNPRNPEGPFDWPQLTSAPLSWRNPPVRPAEFVPSDFRPDDWRNVTAAMGRLNLNRPLPPYPHQGRGLTLPYGPPRTVGASGNTDVHGRFDIDYDPVNPANSGPIYKQFVAAQEARQQFAEEIYERLLVAVGMPPVDPATVANPPDLELAPRRWLAQLAVNMVDLIDEDDISTPFFFYRPGDPRDPTLPNNPPGGVLPANELQWPRYWVFGTELPRVMVNEVLAQMQNTDPATPLTNASVRVFVELHNPFPRQQPPAPITTYRPDHFPVALHLPSPTGSTLPPIAPYQVMIARHNQAQSVVSPRFRAGGDINVLGNPEVDGSGNPPLVLKATSVADFVTPAALLGGGTQTFFPASGYENINSPYVPAHGLDQPQGIPPLPQGCFLLGPLEAPTGTLRDRDPFGAGSNPATMNPPPIPRMTPLLRSASLEYQRDFVGGVPDERTHGLTVVLRRLANPHLPFDPNRVFRNKPNPRYNPYMTVDYVEKVPIRATDGGAANVAVGKRQPYTAYNPDVNLSATSQLVGQTTTITIPNQLVHTFGRQNEPAPQAYDWLVHFDRQLISPVELLHVSAYAPYRLTQRFYSPDNTTIVPPNPADLPKKYNHRAPWFDEGILPVPTAPSHRLYRVFEYLHTGDRSADVAPGGRVPGKININTVWDRSILSAFCDAQDSNHFTETAVQALDRGMFDPASPLARTRGFGAAPSEQDKPFWGFSVGAYPPNDPQFPGGAGLNETALRYFRSLTPTDHPHKLYELPTKIFNHLTTRSNVFAVWLTVGFFEVTDDTTRPVKLGAEVGRAENRHVRHRMFALIDRTNLSIASNVTTTLTPIPGGTFEVQVGALSGVVPGTQIRWDIQANSPLVVDVGGQQETVRVLSTRVDTSPPAPLPNRYYFTAAFTKPHDPQVPIAVPDTPGAPPLFLKPVQIARPDPNTPGLVEVTLAGRTGTNNAANPNANTFAGESDAVNWSISGGSATNPVRLLVGVGDNQEYATIVPGSVLWDAATFTGRFRMQLRRTHGDDFVLSNTLLGNPGPQPRFNPRQSPFSGVVRYLSIIQ